VSDGSALPSPAAGRDDAAPAGLRLPLALLEEWMRLYYFEVDVDLGSSGVEDFSIAELRRMTGITVEELDAMVLHDSRTLGGPELRQALADRFLDGDPSRVIATHGSTEANFLVMQALLSAGDEVVVLEPIYQQLRAIAEALGCRLKGWPLRPERGFHPDVEEGAALIGPSTRMVVVNFPHNPTGATLERDEQARLVEAARRHGAWLVWDGAFSELVYDGEPLPEPLLEYERAVSMGTLSKAYGLPGLRVGWCLAEEPVMRRFVRLRDYLTLHLSPLVELFACRAIEHGDRLVALRRRQAAANLATVEAWMAEHADHVDWFRPRGGVSAFPRLPRVDDVAAFCRRLAEEERVMLVPGECFGFPRHVRFGFGAAAADLERGLQGLSRALEAVA
jgi:capreomycidine synthase